MLILKSMKSHSCLTHWSKHNMSSPTWEMLTTYTLHSRVQHGLKREGKASGKPHQALGHAKEEKQSLCLIF